MADANTPQRVRNKQRNQNFPGNPGEIGRRTGLRMSAKSRNEDGFENASDFFSPESRAATTARTTKTTRKGESTITTEEDMDIQESSGLEITEALSTGPASRHKLPPKGKSPIPTRIGSTPMRHSSIGTRKTVNSLAEASPATQPPHSHTKTATGRLSTAQTNRRLNFESRENRSSTLRSVETGRNYQHSPLVNGASSANTTRRNVFSLSPSKSPRRNLHEELQNGIDENEGQNDQPMQLYDGAMGDTEIDDAPPLPPIYDDSGGYDESQADPGVPDDMGPDDEPDDQLQGEPDDASGVHDRRKSRRRQTRSSDVQDEPTVQSIEDEQLEDEQLEDGQSQEDQVEDEQSQDDQIAEDDEPSDAAGEPPGSDRATSRKTKKGQKASKTKQTREPKKALSRKDPIASRSTANQQRPRNGFKKPGSLQRERHQTPNNEDEDSSILHTRSGRTSYRPLQYWKGERAVYRPQYEELSTIKEIVRMDDVTPVKRQPSRSTSANPPKRKKRKLPVYADNADEEDEELEEDGLEDWEKEEAEGVVSGHVRVWDVDMQSGVEERREQELAFASNKIEARDVAGANFRYAKTLSMPFFGSGMVELPPGGFKRQKNSRKMQMVFFVHFGKVRVAVSGNEFVISKGGVWQVPRGNFYEISNPTQYPAKIFFSQGCEVVPEVFQQAALAEAGVAPMAAMGGYANGGTNAAGQAS